MIDELDIEELSAIKLIKEWVEIGFIILIVLVYSLAWGSDHFLIFLTFNLFIHAFENAIDLSPAIKSIRECTIGDSSTWCMCLASSCFICLHCAFENAIDLSLSIKSIRECTRRGDGTWCMCLAPSSEVL